MIKTVALTVSSRGPYAADLESRGYTPLPKPSRDGGQVVQVKVEALQHTGRKTATGRNPT